MSESKLDDFSWLVRPFAKELQLPMLVSILSTRTPEGNQDSMEQQFVDTLMGKFTEVALNQRF